MKKILFVLMFAGVVFAGCKKEEVAAPAATDTTAPAATTPAAPETPAK